MPKEDDPVRRVLEHPATQTLLGVAAVALSFIGMARTFSTREGRSWYAKAYREGAVAQRERERWHERNHQRYAARRAYFEGRGGELLTERGLVVAGPGKSVPGCVVRTTNRRISQKPISGSKPRGAGRTAR